MKDFDAYTIGLCFASVCSSLSPEETAERLNRECPAGGHLRWRLTGERFRNGSPNPCPCDRSPGTHRHYLFSC